MEKVFKNGSKGDYRDILIKKKDGVIEFFYHQQYLNQDNWVDAENERRFKSGEDDLSEDEAMNNNFYWIDEEDWKRNLNNWHEHMSEKNWFTEEMSKWMDQ